MANEIQPDDLSTERRVERLFDGVRFAELLEFASEVCLTKPLEITPYKPTEGPEAALIAKLGVRGLGAALNLDLFRQNPDSDLDRDTYISPTSPFRSVQTFSDEPNFELVDMARQFGEALLGEAYTTLGQDVYEQIHKFQQAQDDTTQLEVVGWLYDRLIDMTHETRSALAGDEGETATLYHPLRLSPKAIGRYPHQTLPPTCLGASVIAASFLEKAGATFMHTGVMRTALQSAYRDTSHFTREAWVHLLDSDSNMPDMVLESMVRMDHSIRLKLERDNGFHAANVVKLASGRWAQIDPGLSIMRVCDFDIHNKQYDTTLADLQELQSVAPGLERILGVDMMTMKDAVSAWLKAGSTVELDQEAVKNAFCGIPESVPENVKRIFDASFMAERDSEIPESFAAAIKQLHLFPTYDNAFYHCFEKFVLWNEDIEMVLERCKSDQEYLQRRIEDVQRLSWLFATSLLGNFINEEIPYLAHDSHTRLEAGLPAQRIGMAVLSDFATYCDDSLPPSFWLSNWPSEVPITETMHQKDVSPEQVDMRARLLTWLYETGLCYQKNDGIVSEFVESTGEER